MDIRMDIRMDITQGIAGIAFFMISSLLSRQFAHALKPNGDNLASKGHSLLKKPPGILPVAYVFS